MGLAGSWIVEIGELDAFRGVASSRIKDFLTQCVDTYRAPYARQFQTRPRTVVFCGTTNSTEFLSDETGGRRFFCVEVRGLHTGELVRDREQLFAEAYAAYKNGEQWHPEPTDVPELKVIQEEHQIYDAWESEISEYIKTRDWVSCEEVLRMLGFEPRDYERRHQMRIGDIMTSIGWKSRRRTCPDGVRRRGYSPTRPVTKSKEELDDDASSG